MSTVASTGISLSQNYYMRNFYQNNSKLFKASSRKEYSNSELSYEDGMALRRAARNLGSFSFSENDNGENICNSILALVDTYNNTLSSGSASGSSDISRYTKQLKRLAKEHSDDLSSIGITVNSDGTMTANKNLLGKSDVDDVGAVFGSDAGLTKKIEQCARRMGNKASQSLYTQTTGTGSTINLSL